MGEVPLRCTRVLGWRRPAADASPRAGMPVSFLTRLSVPLWHQEPPTESLPEPTVAIR